MVDAGSPAEGQSGLSPDQEPGDLQMAQATTAGAHGDAIGSVNEATGDVFIVHKDGTSEPAAAGTPVFPDDIVATGTDGAVEVVFKDGTTFSLGNNGQMRLDNLIYDPAGANNGLDATVVKGSFVFITGNVGSAQGEGVSIDTPAGTIGIRGTSGGVVQDPQTGTWIFTLFRDPDGKLSHFTVKNDAGVQVLDQEFETTEVGGLHTAPAQTIVLSPAQAATLFSDALHMLQQQFPQLQRSEIENVNPAAGEEDQSAVDPGQLPPTPESLSAMFGMGALATALLDLLGNDAGFNWGEMPSPLDGGPPTFEPVNSSTPLILNPDDNVVTEDTAPNPASGNVLDNDKDVQGGAVLAVSAVNGNPIGPGGADVTGVFGTLHLNADGSYVYTLDNDKATVQALGVGQTATDVFNYTVSDGHGHTASATLTLTVAGTNDQPMAADDGNTIPEDTVPSSVSGDVLKNDHDVDNGDVLTVSTVEDVAIEPDGTNVAGVYGTLHLNADGTYVYTLDNGKAAVQELGAGEPATDVFNYTVSDGHGGSAGATLTITVTGTNDPPVAADDTAATNEDTPVIIPVLANDTDAENDPLTTTIVDGPSHGKLTLNDDGTYTYTPDQDFNGKDSFTYQASDGTDDSNVATVNITVAAVNDAPVAADDTATTNEDTPVIIPVLVNDTDAENDPLTTTIVDGPAHGKLTLNDDGSYTYTPDQDFNGKDSFTYQANDGTDDSNVATVTIDVKAVNDAPVAADDTASTNEDTPVIIPVLVNDTDAENDPLTTTIVDGPAHGKLTLNDDGSYTYTPDQDFNGKDSFTYQANDGALDSNVATVNITVAAVNDAPVAVDDTATTNEDTPVIIPVLANDADTENNPLTATIVDGPAHGKLTLNDDGSYTYTPNQDFNGKDSFTYQANDGALDSNVATVTIDVKAVNDAPVAVDDTATTNEDTPVIIPVLADDTDAENDPLTTTIVDGPAHGKLTLNDDGSYTYTPDQDFNGKDSFTYQANDGALDSNVATVNITVAAVNDAPVAVDDTASANEDTPVIIPVLANDADTENDTLTTAIVDGPAHGKLTLNDDGSYTYTPNQDFNGKDSFTYQANDGALDSNVATVTIDVKAVNDAPVAVDDTATTNEDTPVIIPVLANDTDTENDPLTTSIVDGPLHGKLTLNDDGSYTYTPNQDFNGKDSFTYQANDGALDSNVATVTINVKAVNDAPVAADDTASTDEDTPVIIPVLANDTDTENDPLTTAIVDDPAHGKLTLNDDGSYTYTPDQDFNGKDSFTYQANDGAVDSNVATVNITVAAVNDAPVASNDAYSTDEDTPLTVAVPGLLANDSDIEGDSLTAAVVTGPSHGTLTVNSDGSFTYTPAENYNGPDSFTYQANDGALDSNVATVTIDVKAVNDAPVAVDDTVTTDEDAPVIIPVLANDTDTENDPLTTTIVDGPAHGKLTLNDDGSYTYTPDQDFNGKDSFSYQANDGAADSNVATVTIDVKAVNDAPVAADDTASTNEDTPVIIPVLANDTDIENDPLTTTIVDGPAHGKLTLNDDGSYTYTPDHDFNGKDSFTYQANDGALDSNVATVNITVAAVNDAPVAVDDAATTNEDTPVIIPVLANDADTENDPLTTTIVDGPAHGKLTLNDDGSYTYTPAENYNGPDSFTYQANDGTDDSNVATVNITVAAVNDAPVAVDDAASTNEDTPVIIPVLANDTDTENDPLTTAIVDGPAHGKLTLNDDGSYTYTPNQDFNGKDSFTYQANDGALDSNVATVTIDVKAVNDAPLAADDTASTNEDTPVIIPVLANDADIENDPLTTTIVDGPAHGKLTLNDDGSYTYTPDQDFNGKDSFTYQANDGALDSNVATVTIDVNAVNDAPVASGDSYSTDEDTPLTVAAPGLLTNDSDIEGDSLTATVVTGPAHGTLTVNPDGSFTYTPAENYNGPDSFSYKANDGATDSNVATVNITVAAVNDAPVASNDAYSTDEDTPLTLAVPGLLANDSDIEGDSLTAAAVTGPSHGTLTVNSDGSFTYTPAENYNGPDSFSYKANDGALDSNVATVNITVVAMNDAPVAADDTATTNEDTPVIIPVLANDTDTENDPLTTTIVDGPAHGKLTLNDDGSYTYTPDQDFNGKDSFSYQANDSAADSNVATVTIDVKSVNDAPLAAEDTASTNEDTPVIISMLANDADTENNPLTATIVDGPAHGKLTLNDDGSYTYTPNQDFNGKDSFTYQANDGALDSNVATVTIDVKAVNDAPVASNDSYSTNEDTVLTVLAAGVLANDGDVDGDTLNAILVTGPSHGTVDLGADGNFVYTPDHDFNGKDSFTYQASDGKLDSAPVTVSLTVAPVNDDPVAADDHYAVNQGATLIVGKSLGVLANDTDVEHDALTAAVTTGPAHGELVFNPDGSFSYTPKAGYDGPDSFVYQASDGHGGADTATVSINVIDSEPKVVGESVTVADTAHKTIDLVIILDRSGSMDDASGVPGVSTRLELARAAIAALFESYQSVADLHIQIVDFADSAASSGWLASPEAANAYLAGLTAGGNTHYTAAIDTAMAAYAGAPTADKTEVYFLSDGAPTTGFGLNADKTAQWEGFLAANHVDKALAVGIGELANPAAAQAALAPVAYPNGDAENPVIVTQPAELIDALVGTIANSISGNVLANDDFGADGKGNGGGGLLSITIDGATYSFDGKNITKVGTSEVTAGATLVEHTLAGGLLEFHFDSGAYTYTAPDVGAPTPEDFTYTIVDGDGDQAPATLHINVTNSGIGVADPSVIFGTDANKGAVDNLVGTAGDDIMSGGTGSDVVNGGNGNDHLQGGAGNDSLVGGAGFDILIGGAGNDTLDGGAGGNALFGGDGDDRIFVGTGDRADGGAGNDTFILVDNAGFTAIQGGGTDAVDMAAGRGDILAFNGALDVTKFASDRILGIETVSMADSLGGGGTGSADKLTINAKDVIDLGTGHLDPNGTGGAFGDLKDAPAIRVDGETGDILALADSGWQHVTPSKGGVPDGYALYAHDSTAPGLAVDAYILVQTTVTVTGSG